MSPAQQRAAELMGLYGVGIVLAVIVCGLIATWWWDD